MPHKSDKQGLRRDKGIFGNTAVVWDLAFQHMRHVIVKEQVLFPNGRSESVALQTGHYSVPVFQGGRCTLGSLCRHRHLNDKRRMRERVLEPHDGV